MLTTEAQVETERARRYLNQLCRHFSNLRRHESRREATARPDVQVHVECSDDHGTITFDWGRCTLAASPNTLTLRVEANDEEGLQRVEALIGEHVERFGSRDKLNVDWRPSG